MNPSNEIGFQPGPSTPVVLKLGTAVPLGSAKQFSGDRKKVADFRVSDKSSL